MCAKSHLPLAGKRKGRKNSLSVLCDTKGVTQRPEFKKTSVGE